MTSFKNLKCVVCHKKATKAKPMIRIRGVGMAHLSCTSDMNKVNKDQRKYEAVQRAIAYLKYVETIVFTYGKEPESWKLVSLGKELESMLE